MKGEQAVARTLTPWMAELSDVLPEGAVRAARSEDAVDGVAPPITVEPSSVTDAAAALRFAASRGLAVSPVGGGTKLGWGNPPERLDLVLSTKRLDHVIEHAAGDLVVRADAGVRLMDLQQQLAEAGQRLALDPFEPAQATLGGATLGGIVATAAAGPWRYRYGTPRDLLIGVTYVLADGTVARAGGRVVKNVAGYDLMKLLTGSFGTLALIVEVTFRLHPLPAALVWVGAPVGSPEEAGSAVRGILDDRGLDPVAVELSWHAGRGRLDVLFEGTVRGVAAQSARALADLGGAGLRAARTEAPAGVGRSADAVRVKLTHPPASLPGALHAVDDVVRRRDLEITVSAHAASGVCALELSGDADPDVLRAAVEDLRGWAFAAGGAAVVMHAPASVKKDLDAWGPVGDALTLMRRVKEQFDPARVLNPGRFVGGI